MAKSRTIQLSFVLLFLLLNFGPVCADQLDSVPWDLLPLGRVYRNGILFPWGEFYFVPNLWGPPRASRPDPPDPPDPAPPKKRKPKKGRKAAGQKSALRKKKRNKMVREENENEYEGRRPRKNQRRRQRKG